MFYLLIILSGIIGFVCLTGVYGDYKKQKEILQKDGKELQKKDFFTKGYKIATLVGIVCLIFFIVGSCSLGGSSSSKKNKWDSLTQEEQQWYERNYGGGKSQEIDKAIDNYKSSH